MSERRRRRSRGGPLAVLALIAIGLGCASPQSPSDPEIVTTYRLFNAGSCGELRARRSEIDWSAREPTVEPFFDLIQAYCLELDGEIEAASALYARVIVDAPSTQQAYEASLRLGEISRIKAGGPTREALAAQEPPEAIYGHGALPVLRPAPDYSRAMRDAEIEGFVVVDFAIIENGRTEDPRVLDSEPPFVFDAAALAAVRHWVYEPTTSPRARRARVRLDFELSN